MSYPAPSENFNGIIYNPQFFNSSSTPLTLAQAEQLFLQSTGTPLSTAISTTFNGSVAVNNGETVTNGLTTDTLTCSGNTHLNTLTATGNTFVGGTLVCTNFGITINNTGAFGASTLQKTTIAGALTCYGSATLTGTNSINGYVSNSTLTSTLTAYPTLSGNNTFTGTNTFNDLCQFYNGVNLPTQNLTVSNGSFYFNSQAFSSGNPIMDVGSNQTITGIKSYAGGANYGGFCTFAGFYTTMITLTVNIPYASVPTTWYGTFIIYAPSVSTDLFQYLPSPYNGYGFTISCCVFNNSTHSQTLSTVAGTYFYGGIAGTGGLASLILQPGDALVVHSDTNNWFITSYFPAVGYQTVNPNNQLSSANILL
jgi:hypothetical protein